MQFKITYRKIMIFMYREVANTRKNYQQYMEMIVLLEIYFVMLFFIFFFYLIIYRG